MPFFPLLLHTPIKRDTSWAVFLGRSLCSKLFSFPDTIHPCKNLPLRTYYHEVFLVHSADSRSLPLGSSVHYRTVPALQNPSSLASSLVLLENLQARETLVNQTLALKGPQRTRRVKSIPTTSCGQGLGWRVRREFESCIGTRPAPSGKPTTFAAYATKPLENPFLCLEPSVGWMRASSLSASAG